MCSANTELSRSVPVPSGRDARLEYRDGGVVAAAVKLQELFGLADSPRIGVRRVPVTFELLAPNGRPVQVTNDLKSFWTRGYPEVRKQLRARSISRTGCTRAISDTSMKMDISSSSIGRRS